MSSNTFLKKAIPHLIAALIFLAVSAIYFTAQLQGRVEKSHDIIGSRANLQEIKQVEAERGTRPLWTNSLFGGMPTYQIDSKQPQNMTKYVDKSANLFIPRPIGMFFASMLVFYIMLILIGVNPWVSILGALAFGLTTNNYVLYNAGHITKVKSIIYLGLVTAGLLLAFRKKKFLLGGLVFALGLALNLYANHIQMTYYFFLTLLIYGIAEFVYHLQKKELAHFGKAALYITIGGLLALGSSAGKLLTTYEYSKDTMRGDPILTVEANAPKTSSNTSGLEYGYATKWSNGWMDLVAGFIPGVAGGGGLNYWGPNEDGTAGPAYYGAIIFFLFMLGALLVRGPTKWWLVGGVILISLISMGKNFFLHGMLYDTVPLFNKFRTPNSALSVVAFLVPILGMLALNELVSGRVDKAKALRSLYIAAGLLLSVCLFLALAGGSFFDFTGAQDGAYAQYNIDLNQIKKERAGTLSGDSWRSFILILLAAGLLWAYLKEKINEKLLLGALVGLTVGDLWLINKTYLNNDTNPRTATFVKPREYKKELLPRAVDEQILSDKNLGYRVFDISGGLGAAINSSAVTNKTSYFHRNTGGYHPAKLQRYQDMLDRHILPEGQRLLNGLQQATTSETIEPILRGLNVFNMMNTKYFIYSESGALPNQSAFGPAWFVNSYKIVDTPNEEIDMLSSINPAETAIINKDFESELAGANFLKSGTIELTKYEPDHLTYTSNSASDQLAVFSEVWYGPDKGWEAYIDGSKVNHLRANYVLRALKIPSGQHTIEFRFKPRTYALGGTISLISSLLIIFGLLGYIGTNFKKKKTEEPEIIEEEKPVVKKAKKKVKKKKSGKD